MGWGHKASEEDLPLQSVEEQTDRQTTPLGVKHRELDLRRKHLGRVSLCLEWKQKSCHFQRPADH